MKIPSNRVDLTYTITEHRCLSAHVKATYEDRVWEYTSNIPLPNDLDRFPAMVPIRTRIVNIDEEKRILYVLPLRSDQIQKDHTRFKRFKEVFYPLREILAQDKGFLYQTASFFEDNNLEVRQHLNYGPNYLHVRDEKIVEARGVWNTNDRARNVVVPEELYTSTGRWTSSTAEYLAREMMR